METLHPLTILIKMVKLLIDFQPMQILDVIYKTAMIFVALTNFGFAFYVFYAKNRKDDIDKERDRRIGWVKSLVLDYTLEHFYEFFNDIEEILKKLKNSNIDDELKSELNEDLSDKFILLRQKFILPLSSISDEMYNHTLQRVDELQDLLTENIFNSVNNFSDSTTFQDVIQNNLSSMKVDVLRKLFSYRGDKANN